MELGDYQREAWRFDQHPESPERALTIALLGLGGEVGTLQTTQKKAIRDLDAHLDSVASATEDLGDILWYVADCATWLGVDLETVATENLTKIARRWPSHDEPFPRVAQSSDLRIAPRTTDANLGPARVFDGHFQPPERLPRQLEVHLAPVPNESNRVLPVSSGRPCGDKVGDNAYDPDGYRWHDCFHLAHLAVLGWSPVVRSLLKRKRKSSPIADDVEDGGRAIAVEEGITAMVFEAAGRAGHYEMARVVDGDVLRTCMRMTGGFEVRVCSPREWERAILSGYDAWRTISQAGNGVVSCDLDTRTISARPMTPEELGQHADIAEQFFLSRTERLVRRVRRLGANR